ncbi:hypothetical protein ACHAWT_003107 [Skeletonema menzelii]
MNGSLIIINNLQNSRIINTTTTTTIITFNPPHKGTPTLQRHSLNTNAAPSFSSIYNCSN